MPVVSNISKLIICKEEVKEDPVYSCEFGTLDTSKSTKWTYSYTDTPDIRLPTNWDGETIANHYIVDLDCEHQAQRFTEFSPIQHQTLESTFVNINNYKFPYTYTYETNLNNTLVKVNFTINNIYELNHNIITQMTKYTLEKADGDYWDKMEWVKNAEGNWELKRKDGSEGVVNQMSAWMGVITGIQIMMYNIKPNPHKCFVAQAYSLYYHTGEQYMNSDIKTFLQLKEKQPDMHYGVYSLQKAYLSYCGQYIAAMLSRLKCPNFLERGWDNLNVLEYVHLYLYKINEDEFIRLNNMTDEEILADINKLVKDKNRPDSELYKELKPEMKKLYLEVSKQQLFIQQYTPLAYTLSDSDRDQILFKRQVKTLWGENPYLKDIMSKISRTDDNTFNNGLTQLISVATNFPTFKSKLPENATRKEKESWILKLFIFLYSQGATVADMYIQQFIALFNIDMSNNETTIINNKLSNIKTLIDSYDTNYNNSKAIEDAWNKLVPTFNVDEIIKYLVQLKLGKDKYDILYYYSSYATYTTNKDFIRNFYESLVGIAHNGRLVLEIEKLKTHEEKMNYLNEWETNLKNYKDNLVALANG